MQTDVLLFGPISSEAGTDRLSIALPSEGMTGKALRDALAREHPELAPLLPSHRFARNQEIVTDSATLGPDDEIALIGMVSGG